MENKSITVNAIVDAVIFRKFAIFDNLYRKRIWVLPVIFASIMSVFAIVCFAMRGWAEQAVMIGSVLLIIGLGLPLAYIRLFYKSIKVQIKATGLESPRLVYSLQLSCEPDGILAVIDDQSVRYEWRNLYGAYRVPGCIYLYVEVNRAFILPDGQERGEDIWSLLTDMAPAEKLHDRRIGIHETADIK